MSRLIQKVCNKLHTRSLRSYITLVMTGVVALALIITVSFFYQRTSRILRASYQEQMLQQLDTTMQQISEQVGMIDSLYMLFMSNNLIYNSLESATASATTTAASVERQMTYLLITNYVWEEKFIDSVSIYAANGSSYQVSAGASAESLQQCDLLYETMDLADTQLRIFTPTSDSIKDLYFIRNVFSSNTGNAIATMIISVDRDAWIQYLGRSLDDGWGVFLYNENLELYSRPEFVAPPDSDEYLIVSEKINNLNLSAMVVAPRSELQDKLNQSLQIYLFIMFAIILVVIAVAYTLSKAASYPITQAVRHMNYIAEGHYDETMPDSYIYEEFRSLTAAFNHMLSEINLYHADNLEKQLLLKNAEIQALQSQINPHFLFNTLNTMAWKAQMSDNPELYQMSISLGDLLKTNMLSQSTSYLSTKNNEPENSGGKPAENLQKLSEELKYIKLYIYLQKMRFEDKIDVHFEIDQNLEEYRVPYFCIQTLVENAFVHGLEAKRGKGNLTIIIKKNADSLFISVQDDGVGFQKIPDLSTTLPPDSGTHNHIGLRNLNRRLYLIYGECACLQISSEPQVKTTVSFKIPL